MASWMVHLRIADELIPHLKCIDETTFIMGNIAPDSGEPNSDWSEFHPPKSVTHFYKKTDSGTFIDIDKFITEYFSSEAINGYTQKEYSFFLGYYIHLLTDIEWSKMVREEGVTEENAAKEGMSYQDFIWKNKEDWYDLDFRYLAENPEFRTFRIYEDTDDITNVYMDIFAKDAFENRREYICGYYRSDDHGDLYRDYKYLSKERYDSFVYETVDKIKNII